MRYGVVNIDIRTFGEMLVVSFIEIIEDNIRLLVLGMG